MLLAYAGLLSAWALPACAGNAQAPFPVNITLHNPLLSGGTGGTTNGGSAAGLCISQSQGNAGGAVVRVICEQNEFVSFERQPGSPFLDADRDADRFVLPPGMLASPDDPLWYPGTGTVTTMQIRYRNKQEETMEIRVNF